MGVIHRLRWGTLVDQWLDQELDDDRAERVLSHLERCKDCRTAAEEYACIKRALARMEMP